MGSCLGSTRSQQTSTSFEASAASWQQERPKKRDSVNLMRRWIGHRPKKNHPNLNEMLDELSSIELALRHVQEVFLSRSSSIRETFRNLDAKSYGYIPLQDFWQALEDPNLLQCELSEEEKGMICEFADPDCTGKIEYRQFFNLLFRDSYVPKQQLVEKSTLKQVVVVFRHGARFPLKPFPFDSSWPKDEIFWKTYGGKLTPTGQHQLYLLGDLLRLKYLHEEHLLGEDDPNLPNKVYVYTSNSDRTLTSAQSLLLGMFPNVAQSFAIEKNHWSSEIAPKLSKKKRILASGRPHNVGDDRRDSSVDPSTKAGIDLQEEPILTDFGQEKHNNEYPQGCDRVQTIKIHLADMSVKYLPLLHGYKNNPRLAYLKRTAFNKSPMFQECSESPEYLHLLQKLWLMTGYKNISPHISIIKRLQTLQTLAQQISIERAHKMRLFANIKHIWLEADNEKLIRELADHTVRLRYQGLDADMQREMSRLASGTLPSVIVKSFRDVVSKSSERKLALFSAHDNTLMANLSHLGFRDWEVPQFGAHLVFELHHDRSQDRWYVKFAYNHTIDKQHTTRYVQLPPDVDILAFKDACEGDMDFDDFERRVLIHRQSIRSDAEWARESSLEPFEDQRRDSDDDSVVSTRIVPDNIPPL